MLPLLVSAFAPTRNTSRNPGIIKTSHGMMEKIVWISDAVASAKDRSTCGDARELLVGSRFFFSDLQPRTYKDLSLAIAFLNTPSGGGRRPSCNPPRQ